MRILALGSGGILGRAILKAAEGAHRARGLTHRELDVTDPDAVRRAVDWDQPQVVVNCAAYTDVDGCESQRDRAFSVNAEGVGHGARACLAAGCILVHISTDYVFDGTKKTPYAEDDEAHPLNAYGESKLAGEAILRRSLPEDRYLLIRSQWLYGEGGKNFVDAILSRAGAESSFRIVNDQFGSPTWSRDLASAILLLIHKGLRGTFHVTNSGIVSWFEFAVAIMKMSGLACSISPQSSGDLSRPARRPAYSALGCRRFEDMTGTPMRSWDAALEEYLGGKGKGRMYEEVRGR